MTQVPDVISTSIEPANLMKTTSAGFTLIELLVGAAIGLITVAVAGQVLVDQLKSTERIEELQRQREDWMRTTSYIESEINLAEKIEANYTGMNTLACGQTVSTLDVKMVIYFASYRNLDPAIYYVKPSENGWRDNLLRRCGPQVDREGVYTNTTTDSIIIDGMTSTTDGFVVVIPNEKYAQVTLNLEGLLNNAYGQTTGSRARIQETIARPKDYSFCQENLFSNVVNLDTNANRSDQSRQINPPKTLKRKISQSINQSINQSIDSAIHQSTNQSSINAIKSISQSSNKSINQ